MYIFIIYVNNLDTLNKRGVFMKSKKQFVIALCCIIALCAVFIGVSYYGSNLTASKAGVTEGSDNKTDSKKQETINNSKDDTKKEDTKKDDTKQEDTKKDDTKKEDTKKDEALEGTKEGYYTVKSNDTLYSIARTYMPSYDTTNVIAQIRKRNNLQDKDPIITGQKLIISYETSLVNSEAKKTEDNTEKQSASDSSHIKYTVKSGDTLFSIANEYLKDMNVVDAVNKIKADNKLTSDVIVVNQTLSIPVEQ